MTRSISLTVRSRARVYLWSACLAFASVACLDAQTPTSSPASEDIEPRHIGTVGTTMIGLGGYVPGASTGSS